MCGSLERRSRAGAHQHLLRAPGFVLRMAAGTAAGTRRCPVGQRRTGEGGLQGPERAWSALGQMTSAPPFSLPGFPPLPGPGRRWRHTLYFNRRFHLLGASAGWVIRAPDRLLNAVLQLGGIQNRGIK